MTLSEKFQDYMKHVGGVPLYADYDKLDVARTFFSGAFAAQAMMLVEGDKVAVDLIIAECASFIGVEGGHTTFLTKRYDEFRKLRDQTIGTPLIRPHHDREAFFAGAIGFLNCLYEAGQDGIDNLVEEMNKLVSDGYPTPEASPTKP